MVKWTEKEEKTVKFYAKKYTVTNMKGEKKIEWKKVALHLTRRNSHQCSDRYFNYLEYNFCPKKLDSEQKKRIIQLCACSEESPSPRSISLKLVSVFKVHLSPQKIKDFKKQKTIKMKIELQRHVIKLLNEEIVKLAGLNLGSWYTSTFVNPTEVLITYF